MRTIDVDALLERWCSEVCKAKPRCDEDCMFYDYLTLDSLSPTIEPQPHWIQCSKRLPEPEKKIYWVCTDSGCQCQCRWTNVNHFWTDLTTDWHWHIMDIPQHTKVVAWRELPLPYSEETNDEMVCDEVRREDLATKNDKRFFNALKPNKEIDRSWGIAYKVPACPNCEAIISPMCFWKNCGDKVGWCEYCGQKIDWSGWEEE